MPRDLPLRQSSGCMDGDISVVVARASRRPRASMRLVKVGNTIVALATPAFQFSPGLSWFQPRSSGVLSTILRKSLDTWLSPHKGPRPHNKPTHVDFIHSAFNNKRHSSSCQSKFVKKTTFNNSLSLDLNKKRSGDFRLFPPANFANSAIWPTDKISTFFMQNFLPQKPKDSSL